MKGKTVLSPLDFKPRKSNRCNSSYYQTLPTSWTQQLDEPPPPGTTDSRLARQAPIEQIETS